MPEMNGEELLGRIRELNPEIAKVHEHFVEDVARDLPDGLAGKLSMGVGGVNACVVSRPYAKQ